MTDCGRGVRTMLIAAGATAAVLAGSGASAVAASSKNVLPDSGKLTRCPKVLYKLGDYSVSTRYGAQKGKHPAKSLMSCASADKVALAGKRYFSKYPFGVGKTITVNKVRYTLDETRAGSYDGQPLSGPEYGWAGGGAVYLLVTG